jgi:hypothetical protein
MALPDVPEVARALLNELGPLAMVTLRTMLEDPKLSARNRLVVIKMIMDRYYPEPKINSAQDRRTAMLINASSTDVTALLSRAQQRIAAQPMELIEADCQEESA